MHRLALQFNRHIPAAICVMQYLTHPITLCLTEQGRVRGLALQSNASMPAAQLLAYLV